MLSQFTLSDEIGGNGLDCGIEIASLQTMELNTVGLSEGISNASESLGSGVKRVGAKIAASMDKGSERLLSGAEALEGQALSAAVKLSDGATMLREATSGDVVKDCASLVTKYPFHALVAGTAVGVLLGRSIWRRRSA